MKERLLLFLCLAATLAHAQGPASALRLDTASQRLVYSEVVLVPGASQTDLHARAQAWLAAAYQTTPTAAQHAAGIVQGTGWREIEMVKDGGKSMPLKLWYTIKLAVQPGRYRYEITDFQTQAEPTAAASPEKQAIEAVLRIEQTLPPPRTDYGQQAADAAQAIAETIKAGMANPAATKPQSR